MPMTHILLLFTVELYLDGWPPIGFGDNLKWPEGDIGMAGKGKFASKLTSVSRRPSLPCH